MNIGKTIDELPSFTGTPTLGSYFAIRDMSLPNTDSGATKKFTISDFILLFQIAQNMYIARVAITSGVQTLSFPINFATIPEVGVLRLVDTGGVQIGGNISISNITTSTFDVDAIDPCTLTYFVGNITTGVTTNPLQWLLGNEDDILQYKSGQWTNRSMAQLLVDLNIPVVTKASIGLGNVDNTSDVDKPISSATQTALNNKQPLDSDLTTIAALAPSDDSIIQRKAGVWTTRTIAQLISDINRPKGILTVGILNVQVGGSRPGGIQYFVPSYPSSVIGGLTSGDWRYYFDYACTLNDLMVSAGAFGHASATLNVLVKRGVGSAASSDTTMTTGVQTITGGVKHFIDSAHPITIASGDWIEFKVTAGTNDVSPVFIGLNIY